MAAGLCLRSLRNLQQLDPGFEPSRAIAASLDLGLNNYNDAAAGAFFEQLLDRIRSRPGVEAAGLSTDTPLDGGRMGMSIGRVEGWESKPGERGLSARLNIISSGYFRALGVRLVAGRDFGPQDSEGALKTVIVNEAFAQKFWPGQNAVGKHLYQPGPNGQPEEAWEIIGVSANTASHELQAPRTPTMFRPVTQWTQKALSVTVRMAGAPQAGAALIREAAQALDANVPLYQIRTLEEQRNNSLSYQRLAATALAGFGLLALLLAALGIYGVLAYAISQRTREIGVRMALGAQVRDVISLVIRQGFGLAVLGLLLGLAGAAASTRLLQSFLFGINPLDPATSGGVGALLLGAALLACYLPARRAAQVDPMEALRHE